MGYQALLFCPDEKAARGVTQVLSELDFSVEPCTEPFAAVKKLMAQHFDAVVVDCDNEQNATLLFKSARNSSSNQSSLAVAVVEGQAGVAKAFRIGANLVLTKPINVEQAKGTLRVARGLLRKGDPSKPAAGVPGAVPAPGSVPVAAAPAPAIPAAPKPLAPRVSTPAASAPKPATSAPATPVVSPRPVFPAKDVAARTSAPAAAAKTSTPAPAAGPKKSYPWQPMKPGAEPMASALRKAAEAAGVATVGDESATESSVEAVPQSMSSMSAAAAPAPAKEAPAEIVKESAPVKAAAPAIEEASSAATFDTPAEIEEHRSSRVAEPEPPSFSMGAPAVDEEEPSNNKKAVIIVAIVVILASLAGFLAWKNMGSKPAPAAPSSPTSSATPATGAPSTPDGNAASTPAPAPVETTPHVTQPVSSAPAAKPAAATGATVKNPAPAAAAPAPAAAAPQPESQPAAPALVVHNESARTAAKTADAEPAAPAAINLSPAADPKALSAIGSAPVAVPKAADQVLKISQGVSEGLVLKRVQPRYPAQAMQARIEGAVVLQATIRKDGSVSNLKTLSGDGILARAATEAVQQWKYKPYYLNGEPVEIQTTITVNFRLPH
jgi:TonB family protein